MTGWSTVKFNGKDGVVELVFWGDDNVITGFARARNFRDTVFSNE